MPLAVEGALLTHGPESGADLRPQCHPCLLIKSVVDPGSFPRVLLSIVFCLIDVDWGHLSRCGDHSTVRRGLNVYMHSFDFTRGSAGPVQGHPVDGHTRPYVMLFSTAALKVRAIGLWKLVRKNKYSVWADTYPVIWLWAYSFDTRHGVA